MVSKVRTRLGTSIQDSSCHLSIGLKALFSKQLHFLCSFFCSMRLDVRWQVANRLIAESDQLKTRNKPPDTKHHSGQGPPPGPLSVLAPGHVNQDTGNCSSVSFIHVIIHSAPISPRSTHPCCKVSLLAPPAPPLARLGAPLSDQLQIDFISIAWNATKSGHPCEQTQIPYWI